MCRVFSMLCPSYKFGYHSCLLCVSVLLGGYWLTVWMVFEKCVDRMDQFEICLTHFLFRQNCLKQCAISPCHIFPLRFRTCHSEGRTKCKWTETACDTPTHTSVWFVLLVLVYCDKSELRHLAAQNMARSVCKKQMDKLQSVSDRWGWGSLPQSLKPLHKTRRPNYTSAKSWISDCTQRREGVILVENPTPHFAYDLVFANRGDYDELNPRNWRRSAGRVAWRDNWNWNCHYARVLSRSVLCIKVPTQLTVKLSFWSIKF
jgi:hypothetical protein